MILNDDTIIPMDECFTQVQGFLIVQIATATDIAELN